MSVDSGIIGLAKSGKTTIFNALTKCNADTGSLSPYIATTKVPEPRLKILAEIINPKRSVPAEVRYIDVGASIKSRVDSKAIGGQFLNHLSDTDALINVVRSFRDESIPHVEGSLNIKRDITTMNSELTFSDIVIIEKRLERIATALKGAKQVERQGFLREQEILVKIMADLEKDVPIREHKLTINEARAVSNYQFLTAKPLLIVANIDEEQLPRAASLETELDSLYARPKCNLITLCGKLEMELTQLDNNTAERFRIEFDIRQSSLDRMIKLSYELLGLISFFTIASNELKAWSIPNGTDAIKAAGKIHSDMERGFIRAEVISYNDLVKCGSLPEARKRGLLRLEGKHYIVQDGDVITFLFNV
jgi:GTP-binding protein YchF